MCPHMLYFILDIATFSTCLFPRPPLVQPGHHLLLAGDVLMEQHVDGLLVGWHRDKLGLSINISSLAQYLVTHLDNYSLLTFATTLCS